MKIKKRKKIKNIRRKRDIIRGVLSIISMLLVYLAVLLLVGIFMLSRILVQDDKMSSYKGFSSHIVISGSMVPTLEVYDVLITKEQDKYYIGDIITYYIPDEEGNPKSYTHRIVAVGEGTYITKGDANLEWDEWTVYHQNVVGKVIRVLPGIGEIVLEFSKIPLSIYKSIVFIIYVILVILIIVDVIKEVTRKLTKAELEQLEIEGYEKLKLKQKRHILWLRIKKFIHTKIMKRQY